MNAALLSFLALLIAAGAPAAVILSARRTARTAEKIEASRQEQVGISERKAADLVLATARTAADVEAGKRLDARSAQLWAWNDKVVVDLRQDVTDLAARVKGMETRHDKDQTRIAELEAQHESDQDRLDACERRVKELTQVVADRDKAIADLTARNPAARQRRGDGPAKPV